MGNEIIKGKEKVANFNAKSSNFDGKNANFDAIYQEIFNDVLNNYTIVFQPNVSERIKNLHFDFSAFESEPLTNFITESDLGKILINGVYFKPDENLFKVLNIAAYEFLLKSAKQYEFAAAKVNKDLTNAGELYKDHFIKSIKKELKLHYGAKRVQKNDFLYEFYFDSKQDYINSCVNSAILNACLLIQAGSSVYYDYAQINKEKVKPAGV